MNRSSLFLFVALSSCSSEPASQTLDDLSKKKSICSVDAWCWQTPPQTGNALFGIAPSANGRLIVGDAETFLETTDGAHFHGTTGVGWDAVRDVWADEQGTLWAAGRNGAIWRRTTNGTWTRTWLPIDEDLVAIHGLDHEHVWVASMYGHAFRWDGATWSSFDAGVYPTMTYGVWASSEDDVWISGANYVRRWDGKTWHAIGCSSEGSSRYRVWGAGGDDVWIASDTRPGILRADRKTDYAKGVEGESIFFGIADVHGTSKDDVWFVGPNDLVHYDGKTFRSYTDTDLAMFPFTRIRAFARDEVWLLGNGGALARFDGSVWKEVGPKLDPSPPLRLLWRDRGDAWEIFPNEIRRLGNGSEPIAGLVIDATLVGKKVLRYESPSHAQYVVRAWDESGWKDIGPAFSTVEDGTALWASSMSDVWAGTSAELFHWNGASWSAETLPVPRLRVRAIHGTSSSNVWVVGETQQQQILLRFDGKTWKLSTLPERGKGLFVTSSSHGWVGAMGKLYEITGDTITVNDLKTHQDIRRFAGTPSDLYAAGGSGYEEYNVPTNTSLVERQYGYVVHYDGHAWHEEISGSGDAIGDLARAPDGSTWAITSQGVLRKAQ
jgi:hypothetical protein